MTTINVQLTRRTPLLRGAVTLNLPVSASEATVRDVKQALAKKVPSVSTMCFSPKRNTLSLNNAHQFKVERQKLVLLLDGKVPKGSKGLADETTLESLRLQNGEITLGVRDLGKQVSWRTVFLIEYVSIASSLVHLFERQHPFAICRQVPSLSTPSSTIFRLFSMANTERVWCIARCRGAFPSASLSASLFQPKMQIHIHHGNFTFYQARIRNCFVCFFSPSSLRPLTKYC